MAHFTSKITLPKIFRVFLFGINFLRACQQTTDRDISSEYIFTPEDILQIIEISCFVGFSNSVLKSQGFEQQSDDSLLSHIYKQLHVAFEKEEDVIVGQTDEFKSFVWPSGAPLEIEGNDETSKILLFQKRAKDRTCLSVSSHILKGPIGIGYTGMVSVDVIVEFVNQKCHTFRTKKGYLSIEGLHREAILKSLFHVENKSDISMIDIVQHSNESYCTKEDCKLDRNRNILAEGFSKHSEKHDNIQNSLLHFKDFETNMHKCDKISMPFKEEFFHDYLKLSKPVILKDAIHHWPAMTKWTNNFFKTNYGDRRVHIKLTPLGEFEGVDFASSFENYKLFKIPTEVKEQLLFSDLVVVRPATANMNFSQFLDIVESVAKGNRTGYSAYLEYSSIADIMPDLEDDVIEMPFFENVLELKHLNIWLSDGNTLGKLHFDPFDNFLCQISGRKQVILFDPHNNIKLYEAHIPEALLAYNDSNKQFSKHHLVDSTSMVMSPVDILNPDFERFPRFAQAKPMNCTIDEGDVLFLPAFWWHEVQSYPNKQQGRNLAVNFWYDPFLQKEFPCQECKLDVNPKYRHLL